MTKAALASGGRIDIHRRVFPDICIYIYMYIYMGDVACCLLRPDEVMGRVSVFPFTEDR